MFDTKEDLIAQMQMIRFDEQPVAQAPLDALDSSLCDRFRTPRTRDEGIDFLEKLGLASKDSEGVFHPSVTGVLIACRDPHVWMPNAFIQAVAYRGVPAAKNENGLP